MPSITYIKYDVAQAFCTFLLVLLPVFCFTQGEICDNGIDDDLDGQIDLNDDDCFCVISEPKSLIPNPSFEERNCCPTERSQLDCATDWIQASEPTTDFIHECDYLGWDDFPPPRPFPDGSGIMGFRDGRVRGNRDAEPFWKEYAGACLINPLLKDTTYRMQFDVGFVDREKSPPIDISFFGTTDCAFLPFGVGNEAFGCPSNSPNWEKLGEVSLSGGNGNVWVNAIIEITPDEDIYAIAIGPDCRAVESPISIYYFFDNLILADLDAFDLEISEIEHPCSDEFTLSVPNNNSFDYQWYLFGVALDGETSATLSQNYGEGDYQVRISDNQSCRLSARFEYRKPRTLRDEPVSICVGDAYEFNGRSLTEPGTYLDTLQDGDNCDVIVTTELTVIGAKYDSVAISIIDGETYEIEGNDFQESGDYMVTLTSSLGCDSLVFLQLNTFEVYIPNSFSPDGNGINDTFYASVPNESDLELESMKIYDRWGNLMYEGDRWDGATARTGVYVYLFQFKSINGDGVSIYGDLTLFR